MFVDPCEVNNVYSCEAHHFFLHQGPGLKIPKHEDLVGSVFERWVFHVKFSVQRTRRYGWEQIHRPKSTYSQRLAHSRNHVLLTYILEDKSYHNFATCSGVDKTWHRDTTCSPTKRPPHLYVSPSISCFPPRIPDVPDPHISSGAGSIGISILRHVQTSGGPLPVGLLFWPGTHLHGHRRLCGAERRWRMLDDDPRCCIHSTGANKKMRWTQYDTVEICGNVRLWPRLEPQPIPTLASL